MNHMSNLIKLYCSVSFSRQYMSQMLDPLPRHTFGFRSINFEEMYRRGKNYTMQYEFEFNDHLHNYSYLIFSSCVLLFGSANCFLRMHRFHHQSILNAEQVRVWLSSAKFLTKL